MYKQPTKTTNLVYLFSSTLSIYPLGNEAVMMHVLINPIQSSANQTVKKLAISFARERKMEIQLQVLNHSNRDNAENVLLKFSI